MRCYLYGHVWSRVFATSALSTAPGLVRSCCVCPAREAIR